MSDLISDGKTKVIWLASISSQSAPPAPELNAAPDITWRVTPDGLKIDPDTASVDTNSLASRFDTAEPGRVKYDIEVTCKRGTTPQEDLPWKTFTYGTHGYLGVRRGIDYEIAFAPGQEVEIYPIACGEPASAPPAANEVAKFTSKMMLTTAPTTRAVVA
ncbi:MULTISPECIES: phage tail tube protein [Streptomyces]|uniref:Uncharacterized protein n=4 Tax=Streptomyces rimosus TaxID=1927 RepID=L8EUE6_STRR1|nr:MULTISPECIES: hypothetical protein [Streptomyces]KOG84144.1 hypothetical protein ADK78_00650 [Kitasatospora aureofaciens]MYT44948.1 hypothetical protein [Streptomyces sp. SID5471]KOT27963.1 hypothetical protein ADK84_37445 [Streptomyces sp. NRRL WC-3701]KOT42261.1 hypothetical protein ADK42_10210 [Streptomyces rimosus subsp. rimosus]KOT68559.1 hypothetical protein ADK44_00875 [Streptomyces rimosus subsp. rimosus]